MSVPGGLLYGYILVRAARDDAELIRAELTNKPGGNNNPEGNNQYVSKEVNSNNVTVDQNRPTRGNSLSYTLTRLSKEAPELTGKV